MPRPPASSSAALKRMLSTRRRDTPHELEVRKLLHSRGFRYRVDYPPLKNDRRRRADIVFTRLKIAVFIDGCFWHGCPKHGTWPKANAQWWRKKIEENKDRDDRTNRTLRKSGWRVIRVWQHENPQKAVKRIARAIEERKRLSRASG